MTKVIFFFAGTGEDGGNYASTKESRSQFQDGVIRIYISGCQQEHVGNGVLFPNLEIAANNVRNAFEGNELDLDKLRKNFGDGLSEILGQTSDKSKIEVDDITLEGFSRGAVTTFATAKKLDDLNIPMHIIANQPVPGETGIVKSLYSRHCDLRGCRNIKSAHTFLASHNLEQDLVHNYFFRQMVAKFPVEVNAQHILFPHQHHLGWYFDSPIHHHINKLMAENGLTKSQDDESAIRTWYKKHGLIKSKDDKPTIRTWLEKNGLIGFQCAESHTGIWGKNDGYDSFFTPHEFMQTIYGADGPVDKDPIYLDMLIENAKELLAQSKMDVQSTIKPEQATAIIAIADLSDEDINRETKTRLYEFVLKGSKRAEQFAKIVNKVTEVCDYLPHVTKGNVSNKSKMIRLHANNYKKSVFLDSFEFLSKDKQNKQEKRAFSEKVYNAECVFRKQALGIERNIKRTILKLLTNFITHVTGIALIVNTINKVRTGNWLLFQHNRSVNAVREARRTALDDVDNLDSDQHNADDLNHKPLNKL